MRMSLLSFLALAAGATLPATTRTIDFTAEVEVGAGNAIRGNSIHDNRPRFAGFGGLGIDLAPFGHTANVGSPGAWAVLSEGTEKFLAQTGADATRSRFPVAVVDGIVAADVDLSVEATPRLPLTWLPLAVTTAPPPMSSM